MADFVDSEAEESDVSITLNFTAYFSLLICLKMINYVISQHYSIILRYSNFIDHSNEIRINTVSFLFAVRG